MRFSVFASLICGAMLACVLGAWYMNSRADFFLDALQRSDIRNTTIGARQFDFRDGRVYENGAVVPMWRALPALSLAYERAVAERSPLIALPGTEPTALAHAVTDLEETAARLADMQHGAESERVRHALYPLRFLSSLASLEETRRAFVESGTREDAFAYRRAEARALAAYRDDLAAFADAFERTVPLDAPEFAAASGTVSRAAILKAIAQLESRVRSLHAESLRRSACVRGLTALCQVSDATIPAYAETMEPAQDDGLISALYREASGYNMLPARSATSSVCTRSPAALALAEYRIGGETFIKPLDVSELRLVDAAQSEEVPFYRYFAERGIHYVPGPSITHYACPEFAEIFSQLLTDAFAPKIASPDAALERALHSTRFDEIVKYVAAMENIIGNGHENGAPGAFDAAMLFYVRSGFLALFLAHTPLANMTAHIAHGPLPATQPFLFYDSASSIPQSDVVAGMRAFEDVHRVPE